MIRYTKWVAAIATAVALVWGYIWWTAPLVVGVEGPEKQPIPAGLAIAAAVTLLGWWTVLVMRIARSDGRPLKSPSLIAAFVLAAAPVLLAVFLIVFSNEVIGVWLFLFLGIPGLLGGLLIASAGNDPSNSGSKIRNYLNEPAADRRANIRKRILWATAGLLVLVGALLVWFGIPFVKHDPGGSSDPVGASDSGTFANIRGELLEASKQSPLGAVGDCVNITGPSKNDATVQKISCGDKSAAYRIFQLADEPRDCAADSDQRYAPRATDEGNLILCLDYNWAHGLCIYPGSARGPWHAVRNDCHSGGERPVEVQYDTANAQGCPTGGYPHQERRFTICSTLLP